MKRLMRALTKFFAGITVLIAIIALVGVVLVATDAGRSGLAGLVEKFGSAATTGSLEIDSIDGNVLRHFTITGLRVKETSGRLAVSIDRVEVRWRLASLVPLRAVVELIRVERPDVRVHVENGRVNLLELAKKKTDEAPEPETKTQSSTLALGNVELVDGKVRLWQNRKTIGSVDVGGQLNFGPALDDLPARALLHVKGLYAGLPLNLKLDTQTTKALPAQALSAIAKKRDLPARQASLSASLGRSQLHLEADGDLRTSRWQESRGQVRLVKLKYDANQIKNIFPEAPKQDLSMRATAELREHRLSTAIEAHVENSAKALIDAVWFVDESKVELKRMALVGDCPLLTLASPTVLSFRDGDAAPFGRLLLEGCGGSVRYARTQSGGITLDVAKLSPQKFFSAFAMAIASQGYGTVDLAIGLPKGLHVAEGDIKGSWDLTAPSFMPAPTKLDFSAKAQNGDLTANLKTSIGVQVVSADMRLAGLFTQGSWTPALDRAQGHVNARAEHFDLALLPPALLGGQSLGGELNANIAMSGTRVKSQINADIKGARIAFGDQARRKQPGQIDFSLNGNYDSKNWSLAAMLNPPPGAASKTPFTFEASGELPQRRLLSQGVQALRKSVVSWKMVANHFDLSQFFTGLTTLPNESTRLFVTVNAQGSGQLDRPEANALIRIETGEGQHADLRANFKNETVHANFLAQNVVIDRIFPLLTDDVRTTQAMLNADFNVVGRRGSLTYSGTVGAKAQQLAIPALETQYRDIELILKGDQREIVLESLAAKSGNGTLKATGVLALEKGREAEALKLNGQLDNFALLSSSKSRVESTGRVTIVADSRDTSFRGNFDVEQGVFTIPEKTGGENLEKLEPLADVVYQDEKKKKKEKNIFERIHGTIGVKVPGQFWVKSDEINIELAANLDLGIDHKSDFFMTGVVSTRRGYAEFFGRHFDVTRALVEFQGNPSNPRLDAEAVYRASPRDIVVEVRGNLKNIEPRMSSRPAGYSEEEAIGVLLTGSPDYQSQGGGTSAGGVATGFLVGQLKQKLGAKLPFDVLTADIATDDDRHEGEEARSRIEVGKYLTDKLFIKLGRTFASQIEEPVNRLTLDYRLSEKWSIETTQTDAGRSDIELQWTLNY